MYPKFVYWIRRSFGFIHAKLGGTNYSKTTLFDVVISYETPKKGYQMGKGKLSPIYDMLVINKFLSMKQGEAAPT